MSITVDFENDLEAELESLAKAEGISSAMLIKLCVENFLQQKRQATAWELGQNLFGQYSSGQGNLARDRKKIIREKIHAKYRAD